ncbi:hypothetical protein K7432_014889 [Basidiobolus ranarum]|uniref:Uncharacterized protein n=1 Tax=Basidiobolus ranarum TaxID=34480 RepID=A0ABR2VPP3_9FUNG
MSDISPPKYEQQPYYSPYPQSPTQSYPGDGSQAPNYQASQGPYAPPPQGDHMRTTSVIVNTH